MSNKTKKLKKKVKALEANVEVLRQENNWMVERLLGLGKFEEVILELKGTVNKLVGTPQASPLEWVEENISNPTVIYRDGDYYEKTTQEPKSGDIVILNGDNLPNWFTKGKEYKINDSGYIGRADDNTLHYDVYSERYGRTVDNVDVYTLVKDAPIKSSYTTSIIDGDSLFHEGKEYRKVDRLADSGDLVIFKDGIDENDWITIGKPYEVFTIDEGFAKKFIGDDMDRYNIYRYDNFNRTQETVDVYELVEEDDIVVDFETGEEKSDTPISEFGIGEVKIDGIWGEEEIETIDQLIAYVEQEPRDKTLDATPNKPKNVERAETIKKAKQFIEDIFNRYGIEVSYEVSNVSKKITATVFQKNADILIGIGEAKCNPDDVFNENIGVAIALGRALSLDVSEYVDVVQPDELVVGQVTQFGKVYAVRPTHRTHNAKGDGNSFIDSDEGFTYINERFDFETWNLIKNAEILEDTDAKY